LRHQCLIAGVGGGDQHIADESVAAGALDWRAAEAGAERCLVELEQFRKRRIVALRPDREPWLVRDAGELGPGAYGQKIVAAEDAVAHGRAELRRDVPFMLDGEVGDAGPRIELIWRQKRIGRTHFEAAPARTAMILLRRIGIDLRGGEDRAEKQPRAEVARDE